MAYKIEIIARISTDDGYLVSERSIGEVEAETYDNAVTDIGALFDDLSAVWHEAADMARPQHDSD